jgi:NAD(P)-dependent dehydrogenase (short-subunit alcohol dehydrogenase family)
MPKLWLITGASRALGRAFTEEVLKAGHRVLATQSWSGGFPSAVFYATKIKCSGWLRGARRPVPQELFHWIGGSQREASIAALSGAVCRQPCDTVR